MDDETMWKKAIEANFNLLSDRLPGETEIKFEVPQSG